MLDARRKIKHKVQYEIESIIMDKEKLINLILNNKTEEALKKLIDALQEQNLKVEVILLNRRLESLNQKVRLGIIDEKERNIEENKINHSAISLITKIDFIEVDLNSHETKNEQVIEPPQFENFPEAPINKEKDNSNKKNRSLLYLLIPVLAIVTSFGLYKIFFQAEEVDCFDMLQIRNSTDYISCESQQFDKVYYETISGFIASFDKSKKDSSAAEIRLEVTVIFDKDDKKNNRDTIINYIINNLPYSTGNLYLKYKKGGESYILTSYERYYENRHSIHAVYKSEPLNKLLIEQLKKKKFEDISFFNSMFSLSPSMNTTFLDIIDNEEALYKLSQGIKCLIQYEF